jgi:ribosomal-protein-alanine N-acetyltransferase
MMLPGAPLETRDLILRPLEVGHAHGPYAAWLHDAEVSQFLETRFNPPDEAALEAYIVSMNASPDNLLLGMFLRTGQETHVGNIKIGPIDWCHHTASIGILIAREHWGKGFAVQSIEALSNHAFTELDLERLDAGCYAANKGSRRAFLKAGFVEEGCRRSARRRGGDGARMDEILMGRLRRDGAALLKEE